MSCTDIDVVISEISESFNLVGDEDSFIISPVFSGEHGADSFAGVSASVVSAMAAGSSLL